MTAVTKPVLSPAILADARRAAGRLRKSMADKGRAAGKQVVLKTDARSARALLKLVDAVSAPQPRARRRALDEDEVTPNQAAEILKMSRPSVMRLIDQGKLHPRMVHSRHKLSRAEVMSFAERQTRERRNALATLGELSDEYDF